MKSFQTFKVPKRFLWPKFLTREAKKILSASIISLKHIRRIFWKVFMKPQEFSKNNKFSNDFADFVTFLFWIVVSSIMHYTTLYILLTALHVCKMLRVWILDICSKYLGIYMYTRGKCLTNISSKPEIHMHRHYH